MLRADIPLRKERDCNLLEFWLRRTISSIFYHRFYRTLYADHPYYVPAVIKFLSEYLQDTNAQVFEWGSGISTIWYAKRTQSLVSIEHNIGWYDRVGNWLQLDNLENVDLKYIDSETDQYRVYTQAIAAYDDDSFDIVAVDGRNRVDCIEQAIDKVKVGGYLILDDSHRARYQPAFDLLTNYQSKRYNFGLLQTTIFQRQK